jgi:hypothetical protein
MSDWKQTPTTRREVLVGAAGSLTAVASVNAAAVGTVLTEEVLGGRDGAVVVLFDPAIGIDAELRLRFEAHGARFIALDDDPVRMWRGELAPLLADRSTRLFGVSGWPDLLMVRGLAAETRRHVRYEKLDATGEAFTWLIA